MISGVKRVTGRWLIELLHQGGIRIKQPFKCQGANTSTWDQINWNSVLPVWSDTFISHTDIVTHSFPDVLRMSHLPTRNILKLRIWHIEGKCRVRKTPDDLLNGCRTLLLCENQSLGDFNAGATDVLSLLFWNDQRGGYHQSFRLCWTPQGFMTRSIETFHLWIFCTIKCCSQEVLGKKKIYTCFSSCVRLNELLYSVSAYSTTDYCSGSAGFEIHRLNIHQKLFYIRDPQRLPDL